MRNQGNRLIMLLNAQRRHNRAQLHRHRTHQTHTLGANRIVLADNPRTRLEQLTASSHRARFLTPSHRMRTHVTRRIRTRGKHISQRPHLHRGNIRHHGAGVARFRSRRIGVQRASAHSTGTIRRRSHHHQLRGEGGALLLRQGGEAYAGTDILRHSLGGG